MTIEAILQTETDIIRGSFNKYTEKAFQMLPQLDRPRILDIGCGSGVPTMELARLSNGQVTALDINQTLVNILGRKIEKAGLSDRVKAIRCSMLDMDFPDESFDIIWAEGSIATIGFERGLKEWRRFLKPDGFLAVHDETGNIPEKLERISHCNYELMGYFTMDKHIWWDEYFFHFEKLLNELRGKYLDDSKALTSLAREQKELDMVKKNPEQHCSAFFVMKKR